MALNESLFGSQLQGVQTSSSISRKFLKFWKFFCSGLEPIRSYSLENSQTTAKKKFDIFCVCFPKLYLCPWKKSIFATSLELFWVFHLHYKAHHRGFCRNIRLLTAGRPKCVNCAIKVTKNYPNLQWSTQVIVRPRILKMSVSSLERLTTVRANALCKGDKGNEISSVRIHYKIGITWGGTTEALLILGRLSCILGLYLLVSSFNSKGHHSWSAWINLDTTDCVPTRRLQM